MTNYKLVPVEPTPEMVEAARQHHEGEAYLPVSLYKAMLSAAPAVQGEPVGWVNSDELDNMLDDRTATLFPVRTGFHGKPVYAAPQPAEQQPDVAHLVEALELAQGFLRNKGHSEEDPFLLGAINAALAPYRKGGDAL